MAEEKKIATGYIGNALRSSAADHTTTFADEIFDPERQKYQNEVNTGLETTDNEIKADLAAETARATAAEQANAQAITDEVARAQEAELANTTAIEAEKNRAIAAEVAIIYDISSHNDGAVFESIQALLSSSNLSNLIPTSVRHGGMTIRFIQGSEQSSDDKYVQYRLLSDTFNTTPANWQGVDDVPIVKSNNLVKSGGVADKLAELGSKVGGVSIAIPTTIAADGDGHFIDANGQIALAGSFAYTEPIALTKGERLNVTTSGYSTNVAIIAKVLSGNTYQLLVRSEGNEVRQYYYIAENDCTVVVSGNKSGIKIEKVPSGIIGDIEKIIEEQNNDKAVIVNNTRRIAVIEDVINGDNKQIVTETESGFIDSNGVDTPSSNFIKTKPFDVKKGDIVTVTARGYLTYVAIIAKKNNDGTYESLLSCKDSDLHTFDPYIIDDDCQIVISGNKNDGVIIHIQTRGLVNDVNTMHSSIVSIERMMKSLSKDKIYKFSEKKEPQLISPYYIYKDGNVLDGNNFFYTKPIELKKGEKITFKGSGYYPNVAMISKLLDEGKKYLVVVPSRPGDNIEDYEWIADENCSVSLSGKIASGCDVTIDRISTFGTTVNKITVGDNKMYSSFVDAINSITGSSSYNKYIVEVYPGTYDTFEPSKASGNDYIGLNIPDYVDIIGIGNREDIIIKIEVPSGYESIANELSTINLVGNNLVKNVTLKQKNARYCVHDDILLLGVENKKHVFEDVIFIAEATNTGFNSGESCYGAAVQYGKEVEFHNCKFYNYGTHTWAKGLYMHSNDMPVRSSRLRVENCRFFGGASSLGMSSSSKVNKNVIVELKGNDFGDKHVVIDSHEQVNFNVFKISGYANAHWVYDKTGGIESVDISEDIDVI